MTVVRPVQFNYIDSSLSQYSYPAWEENIFFKKSDLIRQGFIFYLAQKDNYNKEPALNPDYWKSLGEIEGYDENREYLLDEYVFFEDAIYKSVAASNLGNEVSNLSYWSSFRVDNRYRFLDKYINTQTFTKDTLSIELTCDETVDYLSLLNSEMESVVIEIRAQGTAEDNWLETDYSPDTSYSINQTVSVENKIYESLSNNNQGNDPRVSPNFWKDKNRDKIYKVELSTFFVDVYDWWSFYFEEPSYKNDIGTYLPNFYKSKIKITLNSPNGLCRLGILVMGKSIFLGSTPYEGFEFDGIDYSKTEINEFGEEFTSEGAYAKNMSAILDLKTSNIDFISKTLIDLRATNCLYIGDDNKDAPMEASVVFGKYKNHNIEVSSPIYSKLRVNIKGVI